MVMTTGMIVSPIGAVRALKVLQNSMMLTPCWPSAGPTGGAGVALPAGIWSLTYPVIFFIGGPLSVGMCEGGASVPRRLRRCRVYAGEACLAPTRGPDVSGPYTFSTWR